MTSAVSTECYRDVWSDPVMQRLVSRSIAGMEALAEESSNRFNMTRNGYLFLTSSESDPVASVPRHWEVRSHQEADTYAPNNRSSSRRAAAQRQADAACAFLENPTGMDVLDAKQLTREFPFLFRGTTTPPAGDGGGGLGVAYGVHARRCGWLDAQQYGAFLLDQAKGAGLDTLIGYEVCGVELGTDSSVRRVRIDGVDGHGTGPMVLDTPVLVNAAGPFCRAVDDLLPPEIPSPLDALGVDNTLHAKVILPDPLEVIPKHSPMIIAADPVKIPWEEAEGLEELAESSGEFFEALGPSWKGLLSEYLPAGAHVRPSTGGGWLVFVWEHAHSHLKASTTLAGGPNESTGSDGGGCEFREALLSPQMPGFYERLVTSRLDDLYPEMVIRALSTVIPSLEPYVDGTTGMKGVSMDGGYYTSTKDSRPVVGPHASVHGYHYICGFAGYGLMASYAAAEIVGIHVTRQSSGVAAEDLNNDDVIKSLAPPGFLGLKRGAEDIPRSHGSVSGIGGSL